MTKRYNLEKGKFSPIWVQKYMQINASLLF